MSKEKIYSFKIEEEAKEEFDRICKENHSTPSHELRLFVHNKIKQSKGNRISLKDLNKKNFLA